MRPTASYEANGELQGLWQATKLTACQSYDAHGSYRGQGVTKLRGLQQLQGSGRNKTMRSTAAMRFMGYYEVYSMLQRDNSTRSMASNDVHSITKLQGARRLRGLGYAMGPTEWYEAHGSYEALGVTKL